MSRKTIEEYKDKVRTLFIEEQWLRGYNLATKLLEFLKHCDDVLDSDLYFTNISLNIGSRRLGNSELGIEFGEKALKFATTKGEEINARNAIAICYIDAKSPAKAILEYDECIKTCNEWLSIIDNEYVKERCLTLECKADSIHNKGDLLNDVAMINKSIVIYKQLLPIDVTNKTSLNSKISRAYKNINRIIHNQLLTPLTTAF